MRCYSQRRHLVLPTLDLCFLSGVTCPLRDFSEPRLSSLCLRGYYLGQTRISCLFQISWTGDAEDLAFIRYLCRWVRMAGESLVGRWLSTWILRLLHLYRADRVILRLIEDPAVLSIDVLQDLIRSLLSHLLDGIKEASILPSVAYVRHAAMMLLDRHWLWDEVWVASSLVVTKLASSGFTRRFDAEFGQLARPPVSLGKGRVNQILQVRWAHELLSPATSGLHLFKVRQYTVDARLYLDDIFKNELLLFLESHLAVTFRMLGCELFLLIPEVLVNTNFVESIVLLAIEVFERLNLRYFLPIKPTWVVWRHVRELVVLIFTAWETVCGLYDRALPLIFR